MSDRVSARRRRPAPPVPQRDQIEAVLADLVDGTRLSDWERECVTAALVALVSREAGAA